MKNDPTDGPDDNRAPSNLQPESDQGDSTLQLATASRQGGLPVTVAQINALTASMSERERAAIRWLHAYGFQNRLNVTTLAAVLRKKNGVAYDGNTVYTVLRGKYQGGLDGIVEAIERFRRVTEQREAVKRPNFIRTSVAEKMFGICDQAHNFQRMIIVIGDGQIGKSEAAIEYQRTHNHGITRRIELPAAATMYTMYRTIARGLNCAGNLNLFLMREEILRSVDSQNLIIIDELQRIALMKSPLERLKVFELIREIFDSAKCGIVLIGTSEARAELEKGPNAEWMRMFRRRAVGPLFLDAIPSHEDMMLFSKHYGYPEGMGEIGGALASHIGREDGLGKFITYLQVGKGVAARAHGKPAANWDHFVKGYRSLNPAWKPEKTGGAK